MDAWMQAMRRGDFAAAWAISDRVLRERQKSSADNFALPRHLQHLWDGRPLAGRRVLVHCYHGLGDTIQFVRLLPQLRARVRELTLWAQPALLGLLHDIAGADRVEALHDGTAQFERDADVELMELPHILRLSPASIPAHVPYLDPGGCVVHNELPRVGIAWSAGEWDAARSVPPQLLAPLGNLRDVRWVSLQFGVPTGPLPAPNRACADLREQARRMLNLDLIISVDTVVAHLAGALALPVWVLLPEPCDWRWMSARSDSPWYPTMRLFRQCQHGRWDDVITHVSEALATWMRERKEVDHARNCTARRATA